MQVENTVSIHDIALGAYTAGQYTPPPPNFHLTQIKTHIHFQQFLYSKKLSFAVGISELDFQELVLYKVVFPELGSLWNGILWVCILWVGILWVGILGVGISGVGIFRSWYFRSLYSRFWYFRSWYLRCTVF